MSVKLGANRRIHKIALNFSAIIDDGSGNIRFFVNAAFTDKAGILYSTWRTIIESTDEDDKIYVKMRGFDRKLGVDYIRNYVETRYGKNSESYHSIDVFLKHNHKKIVEDDDVYQWKDVSAETIKWYQSKRQEIEQHETANDV